VNSHLKNKSLINDLSPHLFWDVDSNNLDIDKSKKLIIRRVLDYGLIGDWKILVKVYGVSEIAKTAITLRDLDKKSASFISLLSKIPKEQFLCYTSKQSMPGHLNFW
jgi:ribosomal protein S8